MAHGTAHYPAGIALTSRTWPLFPLIACTFVFAVMALVILNSWNDQVAREFRYMIFQLIGAALASGAIKLLMFRVLQSEEIRAERNVMVSQATAAGDR